MTYPYQTKTGPAGGTSLKIVKNHGLFVNRRKASVQGWRLVRFGVSWELDELTLSLTKSI